MITRKVTMGVYLTSQSERFFLVVDLSEIGNNCNAQVI